MPPLRLSDEELDQIMRAAAPLARNRRDDSLQAIAAALATCSEPGPGTVYQICREQQRRFYDPPLGEHGGKYG
jgi:hypothetical protein